MKIAVYTQSGQKKGDIDVSDAMFAAPIREGLMHDMVVMQSSNARSDTAFTKTKGEVRGGGKKPYRQKGTGRARQGSTRNPHYRGGGVTFGPRGGRNYEKNMPKKQRRAALFSSLSLRAANDGLVVVEKFESEVPKTKVFVEMLSALPVGRKVLVVGDRGGVLEKSCANISSVKLISPQYLNVIDILGCDTVLFFSVSLEEAQKVFA